LSKQAAAVPFKYLASKKATIPNETIILKSELIQRGSAEISSLKGR
jgi:hypothetical protein